jgi:outer membrane protein OmpA-like peptidoglycan-associated protein
MNRFLITLVILLASLLFSWFWNCNLASSCPDCQSKKLLDAMPIVSKVSPDTELTQDSTHSSLTPEEKNLFEPLDVYFQSGKTSIERNEEIDNWLTTAKKYLELHPNQKLSLTGHTDSDGDEASNLALAERRAGIVKSILVKDGFAEGVFVVIGKGEAEPIVENNTPENRAKNRRVSIGLIK